jgi:S1-C subfamily serine protease
MKKAGKRLLALGCGWRTQMRKSLAALLVVGLLTWFVPGAEAETIRELFKKVAPSVVVIRARGHDGTAGGETRFAETGSGVLISTDGKVMTAAHVVHAMDQIAVEFLGGETVAARVVASEPAADLSLLQLERMPAGVKVAPMTDSRTMEVGDEVIVVGAPYGLSYSLSQGLISAHWPPNTVYKTMPLAEFFQTTATINTGNSGGPMFNMKGEGQDVPLGGDILLSVEGVPVSAANLGKVREAMGRLAPGAPLKVTILRAGQVLELVGKAP